MKTWIVIRTKFGIKVEEVYSGIYLVLAEAKKEGLVLDWWTIDAPSMSEAIEKHKRMVYPYGD